MTANQQVGGMMSLGALMRWRLRDIGHSAADLAAATEVPLRYIEDLMTGRCTPPRPGRSDFYPRMTSFLKLSTEYLDTCVRAEIGEDTRVAIMPPTKIRRLLLRLCEPSLAKTLEHRRVQFGSLELAGIAQRLLDAVHGFVGRELADGAALKATTERAGRSYAAARAERIRFMDCTPATLQASDVTDFFQPTILHWDVDLRTGALRIVRRASGSPR
jgi:hypothetical protein